MSDATLKLGWLGCGKLGSALAARLLEAGYDLAAWNRSRHKAEALSKHGATVVDTVADLAEYDVVFITVGGDDDLRDVLFGEAGLLSSSARPGLIVDCSTVSPAASAEVREELDRRGVRLLAAPVSGNPDVVAAGRACIVASGPQADYDQAERALQAMAGTVVYGGSAEGARVVKLCHNLYLGVLAEALIEVTSLAEQAGVAREAFLTFLGGTVLGSDWVRTRADSVAERNYLPTFTIDMLRKDLRLGNSIGRDLGVPLPLTTLTEQLATAVSTLGCGSDDMIAIDRLQPGAATESRES